MLRFGLVVLLLAMSQLAIAECTTKEKADMVKLGISVDDVRKACGNETSSTSGEEGKNIIINIHNTNTNTNTAGDNSLSDQANSEAQAPVEPARRERKDSPTLFRIGFRTLSYQIYDGASTLDYQTFSGGGFDIALTPHRHLGLRATFGTVESRCDDWTSSYPCTYVEPDVKELTLILAGKSNRLGGDFYVGFGTGTLGETDISSSFVVGLGINARSVRFDFEIGGGTLDDDRDFARSSLGLSFRF